MPGDHTRGRTAARRRSGRSPSAGSGPIESGVSAPPFAPQSEAQSLETSTALAAISVDHSGDAGRHAAELVESAVRHADPLSEPAIESSPASGEPEAPRASEPEAAAPSDAVTSSKAAILAGSTPERVGDTASSEEPATPRMPDPTAAVPARGAVSLDRNLAKASEAAAALRGTLTEAWRANTAATMDYCTSLFGARSVSDLLDVNTKHIRRQMDAMTTQGRELTNILRKLTTGEDPPGEA